MVELDVTEAQIIKSEAVEVDKDDPQWAQFFDEEEMESYVQAELCQCIETVEPIAIHPYWLRNRELGAMEELKKELGKFSQTLNGYLLGFTRPQQVQVPGKQNRYPQPFLFYTFKVTRYIYKPAVGQKLRGCLSQLGKNAGTCVVFGKFTATVFPATPDELTTWAIGDVIPFVLDSFDNLRKTVILRGTSTPPPPEAPPTKKKKSKRKNIEIESSTLVVPKEEQPTPKKKRKKVTSE